MTGHLVALSVSTVSEGNRGDVEVERLRRVEFFVLPRKGQDFLKRVRDESLSMVWGRIEERSGCNDHVIKVLWTRPIIARELQSPDLLG